MLGLCWTPAAVQSMKKLASTMPSNPDQLVGAILVRKDIFHRFETTMQDTCLDANNLLEYLFSLYNSTATPSERENFPSDEDFGFLRRDLNHNKKTFSRAQPTVKYQINTANSALSQSARQRKSSAATRGHHPGSTNGHRKKAKLEHPILSEDVNFVAENADYYSQSLCLQQFQSQPVFPGTISDSDSKVRVELSSDRESHQPELAALSPFSHAHQTANRPLSPTGTQYSNALAICPPEDSHTLVGVDVAVDPCPDVNTEGDGAVLAVLESPQKTRGRKRSAKHTKKARLKVVGCEQPADCNPASNFVYEGRKKRHPCFCGAMFTRADNLKRHIRKCHEEKLEKLNSTPLDYDTDNSSAQVMDFTQTPDESDAALLDVTQSPDSQHQADADTDQQQSGSVETAGPEDHKWCCFSGDRFDHHCQLLEHTKTHPDTQE